MRIGLMLLKRLQDMSFEDYVVGCFSVCAAALLKI